MPNSRMGILKVGEGPGILCWVTKKGQNQRMMKHVKRTLELAWGALNSQDSKNMTWKQYDDSRL